MSNWWSGKSVLLAGASSGLGEALAYEISSRGANLIIAARRVERLESVAANCATRPAVLPLDFNSPVSELEAKALEAEALLGEVDVLLCSAGLGQRSFASQTCAHAHARIMA
eukprot:CAMPEP_0119335280 /NCGR_PEP_ID=MMETSP1333-20130426/89214_1 /TAXON_ID=418940 /ORGANISM="Scyphosphaera apsteinii, Strain RCC1455" /LENGTH=111 /DNA_ID=CAMNT_0007345789 /DNA_START=35 /DNA_END=367 /DNA_ORIENTATION=+